MKNPPTIHDRFSRWFYEIEAPFGLTWMGVCVIKCPFDLHMYQEIIWETKPDLVIETGTFVGGSALYLGHVLDLVGHGEVISLDLKSHGELPEHPRVSFVSGVSSVSPEAIEYVTKAADGKRCMVLLDSNHQRDHVLAELRAYSKFVAKGCYMIVEDTNIHGYRFGENLEDNGPAEAIRDWQPRNQGFEVDRSPERLGMSQNPGGYLRRVR